MRGRLARLKAAGLVRLLAASPGFGLRLLVAALLLPILAFAPAHAQPLNLVERTLPAEKQGQADDVLILRKGGVQRARLLGCAGDSCTSAGASVPRDNIAWIGLEAEDSTPPVAQDASADAVHLRDGSVHPGRLVGVSRYEVVTERGSQPRDEVAWIHLAAKEEDADAPESRDAAPPRVTAARPSSEDADVLPLQSAPSDSLESDLASIWDDDPTGFWADEWAEEEELAAAPSRSGEQPPGAPDQPARPGAGAPAAADGAIDIPGLAATPSRRGEPQRPPVLGRPANEGARAHRPSGDAREDPSGLWEGRFMAEVREYVVALGETYSLGLPKGHRQLHQQGTVEARFRFCVRQVRFPWVSGGASIDYFHGRGTAKVERNASNKVGNPYYEKRTPRPRAKGTEGWLGEGEITLRYEKRESKYTWSPASAKGPISVDGTVQGDQFELSLVSTEKIDVEYSQSGREWDPEYGWGEEYGSSRSEQAPLFSTLDGVLTVLRQDGMKITARDDATETWSDEKEPVDCGVVGVGGGFSCLHLQRTRLQIRRPRADLAELPILLGPVFEPEQAELPPKSLAALEQLLPRLRCSGAQILVTVKDGSDELFLETLAFARQDALKQWLREHGVDSAPIDWTWGTGPQEDVQVTFGD